MTSTIPPRLATWMLLRLMPGDHDEALAGDLLESYRAGRSRAWYWTQVLVALVIRWMGSLFRHWSSLIVAATWATISSAWGLLIIRLHYTGNWIGPVWRLPWPLSMACMSGLSVAEALLFIWGGVLMYLLALKCSVGIAKNWRFGRAVAASVVGYVFVSACEIVVASLSSESSTAHVVDWRALTILGLITNFGGWTLLMRLPYFIATACALWGAVPTVERRGKLAE